MKINIKSYPLEKRSKISQKSTDELFEFVKELSNKFYNKFARQLPPVKGFRRGQTKDLEMRIKIFISKINQWNDREWMMFGDLWLDWIRTYKQLHNLLLEYDNSDDFRDNDQGIPPNTLLDVECFKYLAHASEEHRVSKELIRRFYEYGYFQEDQKIEHYINMAKSESELKLLELPENFNKIESQFEEIRTNVNDISNELEKMFQDREIILTFEKSVQNLAKVIKENEEKINEIFQENIIIKHNYNQLQTNVQKLTNYCNSFESTVLKDLLNDVDKKQIKMCEKLNKINEKFAVIIDSLKQDISDINNRFGQINPAMGKYGVSSELQYQEKNNRIIAIKDNSLCTSSKELNTPELINKALCDNLRNIGMQSTAAKVLTNEMLAALYSGQIVSFRGSLASIIAKVCVHTLAANNNFKISIPIGLIDGDEFNTLLNRVLEDSDSKDIISAITIDGINLSALEVYANSLRELISERLFYQGNIKGTIIVSTITEGPCALDVSTELCELGPVFHTDCLEWRDKWVPRSIALGSVPSAIWKNLSSISSDIQEDWKDIYQEYKCLVGNDTILVRRNIYSFLNALRKMNKDNEKPSLLQSLAFGWLIPIGCASNVNFADYEELLDGGCLDSTVADARIIKLLSFVTRRGSL